MMICLLDFSGLLAQLLHHGRYLKNLFHVLVIPVCFSGQHACLLCKTQCKTLNGPA